MKPSKYFLSWKFKCSMYELFQGGLEVERPLTANETRRLRREWRARYKGMTIFSILLH